MCEMRDEKKARQVEWYTTAVDQLCVPITQIACKETPSFPDCTFQYLSHADGEKAVCSVCELVEVLSQSEHSVREKIFFLSFLLISIDTVRQEDLSFDHVFLFRSFKEEKR